MQGFEFLGGSEEIELKEGFLSSVLDVFKHYFDLLNDSIRNMAHTATSLNHC
jgi:hypothetical protein